MRHRQTRHLSAGGRGPEDKALSGATPVELMNFGLRVGELFAELTHPQQLIPAAVELEMGVADYRLYLSIERNIPLLWVAAKIADDPFAGTPI
jgi:hypothetical protein